MLKKQFRKTLLASVSAAGIGLASAGAVSAQNLHFDDYNTSLHTQFHEVCAPQRGGLPSSAITQMQQETADEALFQLRSSATAQTFLEEQGEAVCLSGYDIPVTLDRSGYPVTPGERAQKNNVAQTVLLMADRLVNEDLSFRGYSAMPNDLRPRSPEDHFRLAVRLAMTAEILHELKEAGYPDALNAASRSRYGRVFQSMAAHDDHAVYDGTAHVRAIREYFRNYYRAPQPGFGGHSGIRNESIYGTPSVTQSPQHLYGIGERPGKPNIFQATTFESGFSLHYFLQAAPRNNIYGNPYNRPHGGETPRFPAPRR